MTCWCHQLTVRSILRFEDLLDIGSMTAQPLQDREIKERFERRGKKFISLKGGHRHRQYNGLILSPNGAQMPPTPYSFPPPAPQGRMAYKFDHPFNVRVRR